MSKKQLKQITFTEITDVGVTSKKKRESGIKNGAIVVIFVLLLSSILYIIWGTFSITILQGKAYASEAENNSFEKKTLLANRGIIYDRNKVELVHNTKTFDLYFYPALISFDDIKRTYPELSDTVDDFAETHKNLPMKDNPSYLIVHGLKKEIAIDIQTKTPKGLFVKDNAVREYPFRDPFAHLLGYTGVASDIDLKSDTSILYNEVVGKSGIEAYYNKELRGVHGSQYIETNTRGEKTSNLAGYLKEPIAGSNLVLTIDKIYQETLFEKIKKYSDQYNAKGGSGVIIDVHTGAVRALVSYPAFDNNKFVGGISIKDYKSLTESPRTPLLFRPIAAQEPPGSTFKVLVASAALEEKAITESTIINAPGVIYLSGGTPFQDFRKIVRGNLNVRDALMVSSNIFFCRTMIKLGIDNFLPYAQKFGIGQVTGIDLPGEMRGRIPSPENKLWLANNGAYWLDKIWYPEGDSCNSAIGQGIGLATPLQMANIAATIANGGTVYKPYVVDEIQKADGQTVKTVTEVTQERFVSPQNLKVVREGMRMAVNGPRAVINTLKGAPVNVAAKTGTAEFGVKDSFGYLTAHAWVIGFYPYENPQYAFAILLEGGGDSIRAANAMKEFLQDPKIRGK